MSQLKRGPKPKPEGERIVLVRAWVKKKHVKKVAGLIRKIELQYA